MGRITEDMNPQDIILALSEGNLDALKVIARIIEEDSTGFFQLVLCNDLGITGERLAKLYSDCCDNNIGKMRRTIILLGYQVFPQEQVEENLDLDTPIPFIDDSIVIEGVPPYGEDLLPQDAKWQEYCDAVLERFIARMIELQEERRFTSGKGRSH